MARIDRIVNVQISLNTTAIKEQSFSDLLILGPHVLSVGRSMIVTDANELLDLGMSITDPIYIAAADVFSQIPTINRLFIGRMQANTAVATVAAAVSGRAYGVTLRYRDVNGVVQTVPVSVTAAPGDTVTDIAGDLVTAINATAVPVTASNAAGVLTLAADVAGAPFAVSVAGNMTLAVPTSTENPGVSLAAVQAETDDWYGVIPVFHDNTNVLAAADWVEANEKLMGVGIADAGAIDPAVTTDLGSLLQQGQYFRTHWWYHALALTQFVEAAISAKAFTYYPGAETWALKRLAGVNYDNLREGQAQAVFAKGGNTFEQFRNFAVTQNGRVAAGEWIDVIRFRDWLAEQVKINVVSAMINADGKIPYTDEGIQVIAAAVRQALDLGVARGGIAPPEQSADDPNRTIPSYVIEVPLSASVSFNNKANRILQDVKFTARLAGAIHTVEIKGALSYAL